TQRTIGQGAPFDLGYIRFYWDQSRAQFPGNAFLKINNVSNTNDASVQYTIDTFPSASPAASGTLGSAQFGPDTSFVDLGTLGTLAPEPASLTLLALGTPIRLRRRTP